MEENVTVKVFKDILGDGDPIGFEVTGRLIDSDKAKIDREVVEIGGDIRQQEIEILEIKHEDAQLSPEEHKQVADYLEWFSQDIEAEAQLAIKFIVTEEEH